MPYLIMLSVFCMRCKANYVPSILPESTAEFLKVNWLLRLELSKAVRVLVVYLRKIMIYETDTLVCASLPAPEWALNGHGNKCNKRQQN